MLPPYGSSARGACAAARSTRALGAALFLALSACASASWLSREKASNYTPPSRVFVHVAISREVEELDDSGQVAALVETLEDELRARGVRSRFADPNDPNEYPRLELTVTSSHEGDLALATVSPFEHSRILVACSLTLTADARPVLTGRLRGSSTAGNAYTEDLAAPKRVARAIAEAVTERD